jgi:hypothetical protein
MLIFTIIDCVRVVEIAQTKASALLSAIAASVPEHLAK